ncbi:MAG: hypothetical protein DI611_12760 [Brachybacterium faecium]|nr:MAG: hypothetical protein DI611_12760 [Brachybacterium faecium]
MTPWTRRQALTAAGLTAPAVLLGACTGDEDQGDPEGESQPASSPSSPTVAPDEVVETRTLVTSLAELEIDVLPVVRAGAHCVLTVDVTALRLPEGEDSLLLHRFSGDATLARGPVYPEDWAAVRLVDAGGAQVRLAATDEEHTISGRGSGDALFAKTTRDGVRRQLIFAAPGDDVQHIGVLLPGWYLPEVPVIDGAVPDVDPIDEEELPDVEAMLAAVADAPVLPLEGYSRQLDGVVEVIESTEQIEIRLAGDILFDSSSSSLDDRADDVLEAAARTLRSYDGGVVDVVGHTDDVGEEADNLVLSENRAEAVAEDLADRVDPGAYELRTDGRGEKQPLAPNDSDENRQKNRRVTLTLTSERTSEVEVETSGEMPPFDPGVLEDGTEADGPEGFDRTLVEGSRYHISCPSIRRVDGLLEVTVLAERLEGGELGSYGSSVSLGAGVHSYRGQNTGYTRDFAGFAPRLLVGATAIYPLDYLLGTSRDDEAEEWRIASDGSATDDFLVGETLRFVALYRDLPGVDTFVLEQPFVLGTTPFRLTGIPVES